MNDGASAFPIPPSAIVDAEGRLLNLGDYAGYGQQHGLTKRELFAAMAMQGIIASGCDPWHCDPAEVASKAMEFAFAMTNETDLAKPKEPQP